mmetsp:Transcript_48289/g.140830  ORF Transcript_48289/g.140830 Transcript_48289/m.140830 type:complete len:221 (-) Transcript_48289:94-756(-)
MAAAIPGLEEFRKLEKEKEQLENEIRQLHEYLTEEGMPGISGPLVDEEGFPRADLDIYAIRKARNRLACAQTDHKEVMKKVEQALVELHAGSCVAVPRQSPAAAAGGAGGGDGQAGTTLAAPPPPPFAWIDEVTDGSPAQEAGLAIGDQICQFGEVSRRETGDLNACFAAIAKLVPESVGQPVEVLVLRGQPATKVMLTLTPKTWAGRGLLGCHLAPKTD